MLCVVGLGRYVLGVVLRLRKGQLFMVSGLGCPVLRGGLVLTTHVERGTGWISVEPLIYETFQWAFERGGELAYPSARHGWAGCLAAGWVGVLFLLCARRF